MEVRSGRTTSFWHEKWSCLGCLKDVVRNGSYIDMRIPTNATVEDSMHHRRRCHRVQIFNKTEMEIEKFKEKLGTRR